MKTNLNRNLMIMLFPLLAPLATGETVIDAQSTATSTATDGMASSWRASEIIGSTVKNSNEDTIGEIEDLIVDFKSGEILGAVISCGGFLGIADTLSSLPISALHYDASAKAFKTKVTKEQLMKAPQYKKDSWQANKEGIGGKLRSYGDSLGVDTTAPDNASRNKNDKGLTPIDQGNSDADIKLTKDIRADVMATQLSFNAKNVKIITKDGKVTLRGVVANHDEHHAIVDLAKKHADPSMVSDQLQVKAEK